MKRSLTRVTWNRLSSFPAVIGTWATRGLEPHTRRRIRSDAISGGLRHVRRPGPQSLRSRVSRRWLNDPMHTRSIAAVEAISAARGSSAVSALQSMLKRTSGQRSRRSRISGIGSRPSTRSSAISAQVMSMISPG